MTRLKPRLSGILLLLGILLVCMPAAEASKPFGETNANTFLTKMWATEKDYDFLAVSLDKEGYPWQTGDLCFS